ncbi:MAG: 4Fe-4S dicluster domain-containing protein [Promethearchaeota archaeon]
MATRSIRTVVSEVRDDSFVEEVNKKRGGEKVLDCIQCGVCSGSCHARFAMDYTPMQILKMIHLGMKEQVLSSQTIWICASCYACATRCPRGIDIPLIMSALKKLAIENNIVPEDESKTKFYKGFAEIIKKYGRLHEPELKMKLISKTDLRELFQNLRLGFRLWRKGKIKMQASKIKDKDAIPEMFEALLEKEDSK